MNKSFDYVSRCSLNNSASKQAHLFPQGKRFTEPRPPVCAKDSYDLAATMLASVALLSKSTVFPRDDRFKPHRSVSPSPNAYHHRSFADLNHSLERGNVFGVAKKLQRIDKTNAPGPGAYQQSYNPEKKLFYTMRSRVNGKDHGSKLGPGQYQIEGYNSVAQFSQVHSKYNNTKSTVLGKDRRFKDKSTPGPGPTLHSSARLQIGRDPQYSFGGARKEAGYIKKSGTPCPGSYNEFSEFSELRKGGTSRSTHLAYQ